MPPSPLDITKRWIGLVVAVASLASGLLSWCSSYVMQGARLSAVESALAAHLVEAHELREKRDVRMLSIETEQTALRLEADHRLTKMEDGLSEVKGLLQHMDGRLSGVVPARGRP